MSAKALRKRLLQLEARKQVLVARLARQERAHDTRRKILIGALVLHRLQQSGDAEFSQRLGEWLRAELPGFLTREGDKALFEDILKPSAPTVTPVENRDTRDTGGSPE
ncbi:mobilization protein [Ciceribacter selenitireducens]